MGPKAEDFLASQNGSIGAYPPWADCHANVRSGKAKGSQSEPLGVEMEIYGKVITACALTPEAAHCLSGCASEVMGCEDAITGGDDAITTCDDASTRRGDAFTRRDDAFTMLFARLRAVTTRLRGVETQLRSFRCNYFAC
jgi:hypothetical protein